MITEWEEIKPGEETLVGKYINIEGRLRSRTYGWVTKKEDKWEACIPDDKVVGHYVSLGLFSDLESAKQAVMNENNPELYPWRCL